MEWISVKDRLPIDCEAMNEYYQTVDVIVNTAQGVSACLFEAGSTLERWSRFELDGVTHWMPLPEPPKETP